jgi:hypothetical protein
MKIYNRIVIDMSTGRVEEADTFEYTGPVAECKGGGSTTTNTQDPAYNARMATISEEQNKWAREMYNVFKYGVDYDPNEVDKDTGKTLGQIKGYNANSVVSEMQVMQKQIENEFNLTPLRGETEKKTLETQQLGLGLQQKQIAAEESLLPLTTDTQRAKLEADAALAKDRMKTIQERAPVISKLYEDALSGVDVNKRVEEARAGVQQGFANAQEQASRDMSRYGIDPTSGRGQASFKNFGIAKAATLAGASTAAQNQAEAENFDRKKVALGLPTM